MALGSRLRGSAWLLLIAGCSPQPTTSGGIVSVNPCADALLVRLAPERIAAISHYSLDPAASSIPAPVARRYKATAGTAEEVIALRPSLVLASTFTPQATRDAYARAGLRVLFLDSPVTVAASIAQARAVARAVGEQEQGEALAREIEAALAPPGKQESGEPSALLYIVGDLANGSGTLLDELLRRAGVPHPAGRDCQTRSGRVPVELLAAHPPAVVIAPDTHGRSAALRRTLLPDTPQAGFPRDLINCGGPAIVPALARLRAIRASLG